MTCVTRRPIVCIMSASALLCAAACAPSGALGPATAGAPAGTALLPTSVIQIGTNEVLAPLYQLSFTAPGSGAGTLDAPVMTEAEQDQTLRAVCPGGYEPLSRSAVEGSGEIRVRFLCA